jgi:hypothetical protein
MRAAGNLPRPDSRHRLLRTWAMLRVGTPHVLAIDPRGNITPMNET